ncbi:MAG: TonB-dependent receptor plug domain-containing protein [Rhodospirillaceae bacterium]
MIKRYVLFFVLVISCFPAVARDQSIKIQDEVIVTASRVSQSRLEIGSTVDVLSEGDIRVRQKSFVSDLLRDIPGIAVNRAGPAGALTQVRLRGAEANHTLVVIDGIEVGDPFNAGEFEFAHLMSNDISRIEVLRGPQSALWGSDAIGGVINVLTGTRGSREGIWSEGFVEGGSFGTMRGNVGAGAKGTKVSVRGSAAYSDIQGISASPTGLERDGYENLTTSLHANLEMSEALTVSLVARHVNATADQDAQDFDFSSPTQGFVIDSDSQRESVRWYGQASAVGTLLEGRWNHNITAGLTDTENQSFSGNEFTFGSKGRKWDIEYGTDYSFQLNDFTTHSISALMEYEDLVYENISSGNGPENQKRSSHQWSGALQYRLGISEQVFLGASLRFDGHQRFENETTYRLTAAWHIPSTGWKVRSSYGLGVAQPSFFELFGFNPNFFVGNPGLKPEKSEGWDAGLDYVFAKGWGLAALTYFNSDLKDEIFTNFGVFPFTVDNRNGTSKRSGLEASVQLKPRDRIEIAASYSYTNARDDVGARELRRPKHLGSVNATYQLMQERLAINMGLNYNGAMQDSEFIFSTPASTVRLDGYLLANVAMTFDVNDQVQLIGKVENAFDKKYQDVFGFASPGFGTYVGIRVSLN